MAWWASGQHDLWYFLSYGCPRSHPTTILSIVIRSLLLILTAKSSSQVVVTNSKSANYNGGQYITFNRTNRLLLWFKISFLNDVSFISKFAVLFGHSNSDKRVQRICGLNGLVFWFKLSSLTFNSFIGQ